MAALVEARAVKVEFYTASATVDPAKPNSQFAKLEGVGLGVRHGLVLNAWQYPAVDPRIFSKSILEKDP